MEKIKKIWNWIKGLFKKQEVTLEITDNKPGNIQFYSIEHYPLGRIYFAKLGDQYLGINATTGLIEGRDSINYVDGVNSKESAISTIEKHKKQQSQETKIIIQYGA